MTESRVVAKYCIDRKSQNVLCVEATLALLRLLNRQSPRGVGFKSRVFYVTKYTIDQPVQPSKQQFQFLRMMRV